MKRNNRYGNGQFLWAVMPHILGSKFTFLPNVLKKDQLSAFN